MHLAKIDSADLNAKLLVQLTAAVWSFNITNLLRIRFGATDAAQEGVWTFVGDGSPVTYTNWYAGQPDDASWGAEDCAVFLIQDHMQTYPAGTWSDIPCTIQYGTTPFLEMFLCG